MVSSEPKNGENITSNKTNNNSSGKLNKAYASSSNDVYSISRQLSDSTDTNIISGDSTNKLINSSPKPSIITTNDSILLNQHASKFINTNNNNNNNKSSRNIFNRPKVLIPLIFLAIIVSIGLTAGVVYAVVSGRYGNDNNNNNSVLLDKSSSKINSPTTLYFSFSDVSSTSKLTLFNDKNVDDKANQTSKSCGIQKVNPNLQLTRIMKGYPAVAHSWSWTVSIGYFGPRTSLPHACGGSLVNKRYVITATHCVQSSSIFSLVGSPTSEKNFSSLENMMRVYIGITTRSTDINTGNTYNVEKIITYPDFDSNTFKNDLAIIKLDKDIVESDDISYICISNETVTEPGTDLIAVGWGFTDNNFYKASDTLNQVKFQIQSSNTCGLVYLPLLQFCAGNPKLGKDTCNGDSGGPVMQEDKSGKWSLVGVVSNGDAMCTGRGIYTNVSYFYNWIIDNTKLI